MSRFESVAPADGRHFQMQRGMFRVAAIVKQRIISGHMGLPDLSEVLVVGSFVVLTKVKAESALSFMNL
jgi:hypothetical protein